MSQPTYTLTPEDLQLASTLALRRSRHKAGTNVYGDGNYTGHYIGVLGEIGFARLYNLEVDETERPGGDGGTDFTAVRTLYSRPNELGDEEQQEVTIDVQTTKYWPPILKYDERHPLTADYAIAAWTDGKDVVIYGAVSREEFYELAEERDFGYGTRLTLQPQRRHAHNRKVFAAPL